MDIHFLHQGDSEATIAGMGAELQALRLGGTDLLWTAGSLWPRHAPLLFPIVGALKADTLHHQGAAFHLPKHGFARDLAFTWLDRQATTCTLELRDDAHTGTMFPFPFCLRVVYILEQSALRMDLELHNPGAQALSASLGLHPAFRWPLVPAIPKAAHRLVFERDEPSPVRRLDARGLLAMEPRPTPIRGRNLPLDEDLFSEDALIFLEPNSQSLRLEATGGPAVTLSWEGFPHLGVWAKPEPGPTFLCLEPWDGYASPADWAGDFADKPGGFVVAPGATRHWRFSIGLEGPMACQQLSRPAPPPGNAGSPG